MSLGSHAKAIQTRTINPAQRAAAKASLRESWRIAKETGLDKLTDEEIDAEIAIVRAERLRRRKSARHT